MDTQSLKMKPEARPLSSAESLFALQLLNVRVLRLFANTRLRDIFSLLSLNHTNSFTLSAPC